jgi:hypothetical protein
MGPVGSPWKQGPASDSDTPFEIGAAGSSEKDSSKQEEKDVFALEKEL